MQYLSLQRHCISIIPEDPYWSGLYTRSRRMMHSLFAQASRLSSSSSQDLRDIDHRMHDMKYVEGWCSISEGLKIILTNI